MSIPRIIVELLVLLGGSVLVGFLIGTLQHFVSFGIWGYGFGKEPLWLACFEGGLMGAILAVPTGLITYYGVLRKRVTLKHVITILLGSMVGGCALGIVFFWPSAFMTPVLTIAIACHLKRHTTAPSVNK